MKEFTQSSLDPGNCWQTAVACVLEVDPETMPPQHVLESIKSWGHPSYTNILNGYLTKHHGLMYSEIYKYQFHACRPTAEFYLLNGPTVRTEGFMKDGVPRAHVNHCVVGRNGQMVWDVHPSRAGLTDVESWGLLHRPPDAWVERIIERNENSLDGRKLIQRLVWGCCCPACHLNEMLAEADRQGEVTGA